MHECLSIPEILLLLCKELRRSDLPDLLSMALCCRGFLEPALDQLWYSVYRFGPLIACLPEDLLDIETESVSETSSTRTLVLRRSIQPMDLHRYQTQYARRIRTFNLLHGEDRFKLSAAVLQGLQLATNFQSGALAPLATGLRWNTVDNHDAFPYLPLFLGPHVTSIDFKILQNSPIQAMTVQWALKHVHRLEKLEISSVIAPTPGFLDHFVPSIPWDNLRILALTRVSLPSVPILMTSPHFVELRMTLLETEELRQPTTPYPHDTTFSSLRSLVIYSSKIDAVIIALEYLPERNQLRSLFWSLYRGDDSPTSVQRLFNLLGSICDPQKFSELHLFGCMASREQADIDTDGHADISPLFSLSALTHVEIFFLATRVELTSEQAMKIPVAWPHIERLNLGVRTWAPIRIRTASCPRIDHTHIAAILRGCPNLRCLQVRFDATQIQEEQHHSAENAEDANWKSGLEEIHVADSPILSSSRVAAFLTVHCPSLKRLHFCTCGDTETIQNLFSEYEERWGTVKRLLGL